MLSWSELNLHCVTFRDVCTSSLFHPFQNTTIKLACHCLNNQDKLLIHNASNIEKNMSTLTSYCLELDVSCKLQFGDITNCCTEVMEQILLQFFSYCIHWQVSYYSSVAIQTSWIILRLSWDITSRMRKIMSRVVQDDGWLDRLSSRTYYLPSLKLKLFQGVVQLKT